MRPWEFTLSRNRFQQEAVGWLHSVLALHDFGRKLPAAMLAKLLVMASALGCSVPGAAQRCRRPPSEETVRKAVLSQLDGPPDELERKIVQGLQAMLPRRFFRRAHDLALDLHQRPFYGDHDAAEVCGGKLKDGTKWFWTWATIAVVERGQRWTLAMTLVRPGEPLWQVVRRLLDALEEAKIPVKLVLLDRGFYAAEVIEVLQRRGLPFLMPAIRRGVLNGARGPTGTARFFQPGVRGFFQHAWTARGGKRPGPTVQVQVACAPPREKTRRGKPRCASGKARPLVFIYHGLKPPNLTWLRETYRRRFGIETSYRQLGQGLAQTTSNNDRWRMLLVGVALLLRNLWVWRNQQPRCSEITYSILLHQLLHYASDELGLVLTFEARETSRGASP